MWVCQDLWIQYNTTVYNGWALLPKFRSAHDHM